MKAVIDWSYLSLSLSLSLIYIYNINNILNHKQSINLCNKNQFHSNYKTDEHILKNLIQKNVLPTDPTKKVSLISPGGNTPQSTNYTATYLPSRKLSKLDEPDMQDTGGEAGTGS